MRRLDALIVLNAPHPACFQAALHRWRQLRKSWYIGFFQLPWLPEALLSAGHGAAVERMLLGSCRHPEQISRLVIETYRDQVSRAGAAAAMIHWYRALARGGFQRQRQAGFPMISTRTLMIWGEEDVALDLITLEGTERYVRDLTLRRLPGVSHWVQQEAPEEVNAMILAFLRGGTVPDGPG